MWVYFISRTSVHSHTGSTGTQSKYWTSEAGCLGKEPRNTMRDCYFILFYFINTAVCNNIVFKHVIFQYFYVTILLYVPNILLNAFVT